MWNVKDIGEYFKEQEKKGVKFTASLMSLKCVDYYMAPYGDWYLYEDAEGNLWQEYFSIGD